jgi:predicted dehydrogenase
MEGNENRRTVAVGVVGIGGWGKNLARTLSELPEAELRYVCDLDAAKLALARRQYPDAQVTPDYGRLLGDRGLEAVVIATVGSTHHALCKAALEADKDVFVEKPFALSSGDAEELVRIASTRGRVLMVGHLLEYHPVVERLRELIERNELGRIYYAYSQRLNLGTIRQDENALWNFAPHDISSIMYMLGRRPTDVSARGQSCLQRGIEDVVFMTLNFGDDAMANVHVSWLDPHKTRRITLVGSQKMAVFDDGEPTEKLRIYDRGAHVSTDYNNFAEYVGLRFGDITLPYIRSVEPLRVECQHFLDCVRNRSRPRSDGCDGLAVVRVLEAAELSLERHGQPVHLTWDDDSVDVATERVAK